MTFDPDRWLAEGRVNQHLLPDGVTLPEPEPEPEQEPDYEAWRPALGVFYAVWGAEPLAASLLRNGVAERDKAIIRALIAAFEHAPGAAAPTAAGDDGWISWRPPLGAPVQAPVPPDTLVEIWLRFDARPKARRAGPACSWSWAHGGGGGDIVKYRVVGDAPCGA